MMTRITPLRTLIIIAIIFCYSTHTFGDDRSHADCKTLVASIADEKVERFDYQHRSFTSTFVTSGLMFAAAQGIRTVTGHDTFFSKAFWLTAPTDLLLTLTTHAVTLSNIKPLKHFLEGKFLGPKLEPHMKIFTNAMLGVAYIHASWVAAGISITPTKAAMSIGLCAVVYPTLYFVKTRLFRTLPLRRDRLRMQQYRVDTVFGEAFQRLANDVAHRAREAQIPENEIELLSLTFIDNLIADWPIENKMDDHPLKGRNDLESLAKKIHDSKSIWKIRKSRQALMRHLVAIAKDPTTDAESRTEVLNLLNLGDPFTPESSLAFHEAMISRARSQKLRVWGSSLLDQALSVGVAGGVGMYYVNDYAVHH